ncbi:MAG: acyltransferase [Acidimicrobiales bacterium]
MSQRTSTPTALTPASSPSLTDLAAGATPNRNRAVDFYRAVAMVAVALGHWMAIAVSANPDGGFSAGNALEQAAGLSWISWVFQVMPLFFVVGGFSSAMSLDAHNAKAGRPQDWVAARIRRMVAPAIVLAMTWLALIVTGYLSGLGAIIAAGATAAAIPLWFLSNYTIDTAIAPYVLPRFRRNPVRFAATGAGAFVFFEMLNFAGVPILPHVNWILGWLLFQVAGFAWRDGLLPTGRRMAMVAAVFWGAALAAVTVGPYPTSMVNIPGLHLSPTNPPTIALMLFGAAYSATAIAAAPAISSWLTRNTKAWAATVAANTIAMSVYLWHFTAASVAGAAFYLLGWLPTAEVGTTDWWIQKMPLLAASAVVLAGIVALVARYEQRALLAERTTWDGSEASMVAVALVVSACFKLWVMGNIVGILIATATLTVLWFRRVKA